MWKEQGGLCCYCMSRVTAESGHIEHWHPQSRSRDEGDKRDLEYANLLLVCDGGANSSGRGVHCDKSRGSKPLKFNPADPRHDVESHIRYLANGRIECSDDAEFNDQLQNTLNLNAAHLVGMRARAIEEMQKRTRGCSSSELQKMRKKHLHPNKDGALPPFCMTIVYFIDKKIKKRAFL